MVWLVSFKRTNMFITNYDRRIRSTQQLLLSTDILFTLTETLFFFFFFTVVAFYASILPSFFSLKVFKDPSNFFCVIFYFILYRVSLFWIKKKHFLPSFFRRIFLGNDSVSENSGSFIWRPFGAFLRNKNIIYF